MVGDTLLSMNDNRLPLVPVSTEVWLIAASFNQPPPPPRQPQATFPDLSITLTACIGINVLLMYQTFTNRLVYY